jgi:ABC-2 type transport system ATP-binding protein
VLRPDAGSVLVRGYATGLPAASAGFLNFRTLRENLRRNLLLAGTPSARANELVPEVAEWAELTPYLDRRQSTLTRQQVRLAGQAVALHTEPAVFLADEDLAGIPRAFRRKAIERLAAYPDSTHALVVVTNRAELTRRMCTRGVVMNEGKITFDGPLEDGLQHYHRHHRKQPPAQEPQQEPAEPPEDTEDRGEDP